MIISIILSIIAPIVIYLGLEIFNSITLTFVMFHGIVCLGIPIIDLFIIKKCSLKKVFKTIGFINYKKTIVWSILTGILFFLIIILFFSFLKKYIIDIKNIETLLEQWNLNPKYMMLFLFIMIFANSVLEEVYWRGYIFSRFKRCTNIKIVIILTSLFYCSYHFITTINLFSVVYGIIFSVVILGAGIFWGFMRYKFDSIYFPMISHLLADLGIMLIYVKYFT